MDAAYISAFAALAGTAIGGLTSFVTSWMTQHSQARALRLASEREMARLYPDCEVGAIPPLGPLYKQRVFVDRRLAREAAIVFSAGTHTDAIRMGYAAFAGIAHPLVGEFGELPKAEESAARDGRALWP